MEYFAVTTKSAEVCLVKELEKLGAERIKKSHSGVFFSGDRALGYRANLSLRTATKILQKIDSFRCRNENELYLNVLKINWPEFFEVTKTIFIRCDQRGNLFKNTHFLELKIKDAIADKFRTAMNKRPYVDKEKPDISVYCLVEKENATIYFNLSGESLHRRGYRKETSNAPIKETLAATLIDLSGWDGSTYFYDPFCGFGTLVLEAAIKAHRYPPGLIRPNFTFAHLKDFDKKLWNTVRSEAQKKIIINTEYPIFASDNNGDNLKILQKSISTLPFKNSIILKKLDLSDIRPFAEEGTIICNPPYGIRLKQDNLNYLYKRMGEIFNKYFQNHDIHILMGNEEFKKHFGLTPVKAVPVNNGKIECEFLTYRIK